MTDIQKPWRESAINTSEIAMKIARKGRLGVYKALYSYLEEVRRTYKRMGKRCESHAIEDVRDDIKLCIDALTEKIGDGLFVDDKPIFNTLPLPVDKNPWKPLTGDKNMINEEDFNYDEFEDYLQEIGLDELCAGLGMSYVKMLENIDQDNFLDWKERFYEREI